MTTQRIFFGLLPLPVVRDALQATIRTLETEVGGRATSTATLHMTLAFLGERSGMDVAVALNVGDALRARAFELTLDRLQRWPNGILWMGCRAPPDALGALVTEVREGLRQAGIALAAPGFFPHITLMRKTRAPFEARTLAPIVWPVAGFALIESQRQPAGPEYRTLKGWPLT